MATISASTNYTNAQAALIVQIDSLVNDAAARGQYFVTTGTLYANQQSYLITNGYTVTLANGIYKISWDPALP